MEMACISVRQPESSWKVPPAYASKASVTHMPHTMGPRAAISAIICSSPYAWPCSETLNSVDGLTG